MTRMQPALLLARMLIPLLFISLLTTGERSYQVELVLLAARRDLAEGSPLSASERIATVARHLQGRADLWELAGHYAMQGGEAGLARTYFQQASSAGGLSPDGLEALGEAAWLLGDLHEAVEAWQAAVDAGGASISLYEKLAGAYRDLKDYPAVIHSLQSLVALRPAEARYPYELGLLLAARQPESALAPLALAAELDATLRAKTQVIERSIRSARLAGDPVYTLVASGRALASLDEWELAAEAFRLAVEANPGYAEAWAFLGEARQHLNQDALPALEKALALDPRSIAANTFLALYWQRKNRHDLALVYLHAAEGLEPQNPALQAEMGNSLATLGKFESALAHYQKATALAPRDPLYWRSLAGFSIKYEIEVREIGLPAARQAVLLDPKVPASLDVMAQVLTLLGDPASAERFLYRALQSDPGYAAARVHLGLVYLLRGKPGLAREQLDLVLTLASPGTVEAEHARRLLKTYFP